MSIMKFKIFLILLLTCSAFAFSQKKSEKGFINAKYKCTYSIKYINDTIKMTHGTEDHFILLIGDDLTYGYSYLAYREDSLMNAPNGLKKYYESFNDAVNNGAFRNLYSSHLMHTRLYKDYKKKKINVLDRFSRFFFIWEEDLLPQTWSLQDDTMTIAGYNCQKAECDYRGRSYEAWFASEIPIDEGPWKFNGLPGLIMKLYDTKHHYEFELVGLKRTDEKININPLLTKKITGVLSWDLKETDRLTFLKTIFGERGDAILSVETAKFGITHTPVVRAYGYIELDY